MVGEVGFNFLGVAGALLHQLLLTIVGVRMNYSWRWLVVPWVLWAALVGFHHYGFYQAAAEAGTTFDKAWFLSNSIIMSVGLPALAILAILAVRGVRPAKPQSQGATHAQG